LNAPRRPSYKRSYNDALIADAKGVVDILVCATAKQVHQLRTVTEPGTIAQNSVERACLAPFYGGPVNARHGSPAYFSLHPEGGNFIHWLIER
jgi:hypothetical protein